MKHSLVIAIAAVVQLLCFVKGFISILKQEICSVSIHISSQKCYHWLQFADSAFHGSEASGVPTVQHNGPCFVQLH